MRATQAPAVVVCTILFFCAAMPAQNKPQTQQAPFTSFERERAEMMLQVVASDVKKHYYDQKFHGLDWDATVRDAKEKIDKSTSQNTALSHIAAALIALDDSHTFFLPPSRPYIHDYGLQFQMIGDSCFVLRVRPGSDAESKGIKAGDQVLSINGFQPSRQNLWQMEYVYQTLRPQMGLQLDLRTPANVEHKIDAMAKFRDLKRIKDLTGEGRDDLWDLYRAGEAADRLMRVRTVEFGEDLMVLKLPVFDFNESEVQSMIGKARKYKALIMDLRENGGGRIDTLKYLAEGIFENDVKIADRVSRKDSKPLIEKFHPHNPFGGKLVVLVDSKSASASEIFARAVQLEKRGTIVGDHSSGSVMESLHYSYHLGQDIMVFYGASITEADVIMSDGKSLEHVGITPDEVVLPTAADMASGRDPAMARAAEMLGVKITPEEAGKLFPYEWPKVE